MTMSVDVLLCLRSVTTICTKRRTKNIFPVFFDSCQRELRA